MIRIAFINNKGGVGKTTSAFNVASYFARKGKKVLMVDLDAQANLTLYAGLKPNELKKTIYDLMEKSSRLAETVEYEDVKKVLKTSKHGIDIIPSNIGTERINQNLFHAINKEGLLNSILETVDDKYDFCIIDSPPNLGLSATNAITASDYVFIPIKAGPWEILGMKMLMALITEIKKISKRKVEIGGVFFTQYFPHFKVSKNVENLLYKFNFRILEAKINNSVKLIRAVQEYNSIFEYNKKDNIPYDDYENLCKEIEKIICI